MCLQNMPAPARPKNLCTSFCTRDAEHSTCDLMPSRFFQRQWQSLQGNKGIMISTSSIRNMFFGTIWCKHENPSKFTWYHVYQLCNWDLWSWGRIPKFHPTCKIVKMVKMVLLIMMSPSRLRLDKGHACGNRWSMMLLSFPATAKSPKTWRIVQIDQTLPDIKNIQWPFRPWLTDDSLMTHWWLTDDSVMTHWWLPDDSWTSKYKRYKRLQPSTLPWQTLLLRKDRHISPRHLKCVPSALRLGGNLNKFE